MTVRLEDFDCRTREIFVKKKYHFADRQAFKLRPSPLQSIHRRIQGRPEYPPPSAWDNPLKFLRAIVRQQPPRRHWPPIHACHEPRACRGTPLARVGSDLKAAFA